MKHPHVVKITFVKMMTVNRNNGRCDMIKDENILNI